MARLLPSDRFCLLEDVLELLEGFLGRFAQAQ